MERGTWRRLLGAGLMLALLLLVAWWWMGDTAARSSAAPPPPHTSAGPPAVPRSQLPIPSERPGPRDAEEPPGPGPRRDAFLAAAEAAGRVVVRCPSPGPGRHSMLTVGVRGVKEGGEVLAAPDAAEGAVEVHDTHNDVVAVHRWWTDDEGQPHCELLDETRATELRVRVLLPDGRPAVGAEVSSNSDVQTVDEAGRAVLSVVVAPEVPTWVVAVDTEYAPILREDVRPGHGEVELVFEAVTPTEDFREALAATLHEQDELAAAMNAPDLSPEAAAVLLRWDAELQRQIDGLRDRLAGRPPSLVPRDD